MAGTPSSLPLVAQTIRQFAPPIYVKPFVVRCAQPQSMQSRDRRYSISSKSRSFVSRSILRLPITPNRTPLPRLQRSRSITEN